jgi:plasmid stabilization system protein ParE
MRRIEFTRAAVDDLADALDWYEEHASGLGLRLVEEVRVASERLVANPKQFPVVLADVRSARLRRFPYRLLFRETRSHIRVIAVFHMSRDPRRWQARL